MSDNLPPASEYQGVHCTLAINRPARAIVTVILAGSDIDEFADYSMQELPRICNGLSQLSCSSMRGQCEARPSK